MTTTHPFTHCQVILLAAGAGRRFTTPPATAAHDRASTQASTQAPTGRLPKLLHGQPPLVSHALRHLREGLGPTAPVLAVVRPGDTTLAQVLQQHGVSVTVCPQADAGMGASLAHAASLAADDVPVLVALADMPAIRPATFNAVQAALCRGASLVQPVWRDQPGHPVGFHPRWLPALRALHGDEGARRLLRAHADEVMRLPVDDAGVVMDIDTPAQWDHWAATVARS